MSEDAALPDDLEGSLDQLVLIVGYSTQGKSASLRNIRNQERWVYLGTESGKRLPFKNKFNRINITDPYDVIAYFDECIANKDDVDGIIIDSITFLMDMFETQYVIGAANTMQGWSNYQQFFKQVMQQKVAEFGKPVIIIAHVRDELDEKNQEMKTAVPIKGALKNNGVEAYFTTVVAAKKVPIKELEKYGSKMLVITDEERELGYKHVFQTRITKGTTGERIRSPMGMFDRAETYIDNDAQVLLDHLHEFYEG
ncbi:Sak4-like ssDNA annealing protein [Pseudomonas phage Zuri]|uniref:DNA primase n=1 Tax=Pseudomonas phage Zuri TaxID=2604899 RepID=A0A5C1K5P3_9CAUD|nr:Sak4-like ssDNA annealing protein [Pseudomonas phage Zuri]QEM41163.1 DNA primase [Pseudomonas phage Zuri]